MEVFIEKTFSSYEDACDSFFKEWEGKEIDTGGSADCCDLWIVGEQRCSCGNRKMYVDAMKNNDGTYLPFAQAN